MKKKIKIVPYGDGYLPIETAAREKKLQALLDNPPVFDVKNKKEITNWAKLIFDLYKTK